MAAGLGGFFGAVAKEFASWLFKEINRWRDEKAALLDVLLETVESVAYLAAEHWSLPGSAPDRLQRTGKVVGRLHYCSELYPVIFAQSMAEKQNTDMVFTRFRRALTGDRFDDARRPADPGRTAEIELAKYELISQLRLGRMRATRLWRKAIWS